MGRVGDAEKTRDSLDAVCARLAATQYGVFSREQAARIGVSKDVIRRRLQAGRWDSPAPFVLRIAGAPPLWHQKLMTAHLSWGAGTAVSHRAAAALLGVAGFTPGPIEITVPPSRRRKGPGVIHRNALGPRDVITVAGIPVTNPTRTLLDIASVEPAEKVEEALDDMLRRGLVSIARLRWCLGRESRRGRPGIVRMRALLAARAASSVPQSVFETRLLRVMKRARLPAPVVQHRVSDAGRLVAVIDFAYPLRRLAIEADGYRWHSGRTRWEQDLARRNRLTLLGWRIVHVAWTDLNEQPDRVIDSIKIALASDPS